MSKLCVRPRSSPHSIGCDVVERLLARTPIEEVGLRSAFFKKYGAKLRLWLLETCSFSHGAQRQRARADILGEGLRSVPNGHNAFVPVWCAYPVDHLGQALEEPTFNIPGRCQVSHALTYVVLLIMGILALLTKAGFVIPVLWSLFAGLINGTVSY